MDEYSTNPLFPNTPMRACPFCNQVHGANGVFVLRRIDRYGYRTYRGCCCRCRALGPEADTVEDAADRWNQRSGEAECRDA